jgi:membrane protein YqaA with SNARE-associated domain
VSLFAPTAHRRLLPRWAIHLGAAGLFLTSALDASVIPLPVPGTTDLLLLWLGSHNGSPWLLASSAIVGSLIGGYTTWNIGKRGGEAALKRWVPARILKRIVGWVEHNPSLAVFLPAILPPPIPLSPFLLAAGALGVARRPFLLAFGAARILRYSFVAWLAVVYGRRVVHLWAGTLQKWSVPLLWIFAVVVISGIALGVMRLRSHGNASPEQDQAGEPAAMRGD